jgi:hypothetical protein
VVLVIGMLMSRVPMETSFPHRNPSLESWQQMLNSD